MSGVHLEMHAFLCNQRSGCGILESQSTHCEKAVKRMTKKEYIVELKEEEADELMSEHWVSKLVRCKDCKRKDTLSCPKAPKRPDDWYCADGERRETE